MKTIMSIVLVCAALVSLKAFAQNNSELFSKEVERIVAQYEAKKISQSVAAKEILIASKAYFPSDKLTQDYYQSLADYSDQLAKKTISQKQFDELTNARVERYAAAMEDRKEANARAFRQAELENDRMRQAQASAYADAAQQYRNTAATATMLNGIGRAFNNSFGQSITPPLQICNYYGGTRYCQ
ncbi:hypothetical protein [Polynucleobacter sp. MWH-Berg-3C6]|uniref:hypothetical protein n=1 Tax=Polynucleobacter sp. MWH-Berg-3C6 TaxID=1855882 RepID=UPI001C0C059E|nr:hypothetical protein [Polynucleobacter sp. MWH-Berg-3C6]MBU3551392.1 hypothetical protein [Polynucleobacter sp. MWH-Berg-3C6]